MFKNKKKTFVIVTVVAVLIMAIGGAASAGTYGYSLEFQGPYASGYDGPHEKTSTGSAVNDNSAMDNATYLRTRVVSTSYDACTDMYSVDSGDSVTMSTYDGKDVTGVDRKLQMKKYLQSGAVTATGTWTP